MSITVSIVWVWSQLLTVWYNKLLCLELHRQDVAIPKLVSRCHCRDGFRLFRSLDVIAAEMVWILQCVMKPRLAHHYLQGLWNRKVTNPECQSHMNRNRISSTVSHTETPGFKATTETILTDQRWSFWFWSELQHFSLGMAALQWLYAQFSFVGIIREW